MSALLVSTGGLDAVASIRIVLDAESFRERGGDIWLLDSPTGDIDGASCAGLTSLPHVPSAIALRPAGAVIAPQAPRSPVDLFEFVGDPRVFTRDAVGGAASTVRGVWLSTAASDIIGRNLGDISLLRTVTTSPGTGALSLVSAPEEARVLGVFPVPERAVDKSLGASVLAEVPDRGRFTTCLFRVWPYSGETIALVTALVPRPGEAAASVQLRQLVPSVGQSFDAQALYGARLTRSSPVALILGSFGLGLVWVRARRFEATLAVSAGLPRASLALQHALEWSLPYVSATVFTGVTLAICVSVWLPHLAPWPVVTHLLAPAAIGLAAGWMGIAIAACRLRADALYRLFKDR